MAAICPKCGADITEIKAKQLPGTSDTGKKFTGAVFTCPRCDAILGAGADPIISANDIVKRITALLNPKK